MLFFKSLFPGKSPYSETILEKRFAAAIDHKILQLRQRYSPPRHKLPPSYQSRLFKCDYLHKLSCL